MDSHTWKVGDQALIARHKVFGKNKSKSNSMGRIVYIRDDGIVDLVACDGEIRSGVLSDLDPIINEQTTGASCCKEKEKGQTNDKA